ncbi:serine protease family protein [Paraburkholderia megapolitana]|uniref:hypothetical protein n=1 Tax=Paraburkholderia megapolitana TaxID=420953 RepID=UPI0011601ECF|nr:hypothetical protein [Paraburkholderia megapolitana]QDQ83666.1 hypothetical protein FNZ07_21115 [Paraburkholderia megapolitana]
MKIVTMRTSVLAIFRCARPILFYSEYPEFPFSICGSGFLVRYHRRVFAITARHVTANFDLAHACMQYHPSVYGFVPMSFRYVFAGGDPSDTDQYDLVIFEVDGSKLDISLFSDAPPYELSDSEAPPIFDKTSIFVVQGYPSHLHAIECETELEAIISRPMLIDAEYAGPCVSDRVHVLRVHCADQIESFDGMSGAPVFQVLQSYPNLSKIWFAGMVLRGGTSSGELRFLERERITEALTRIIHKDVVPAKD